VLQNLDVHTARIIVIVTALTGYKDTKKSEPPSDSDFFFNIEREYEAYSEVAELHACCTGYPLIDAGTDAEEYDAGSTDGQRSIDGPTVTEGGQRMLLLLDVHCLDNEQIVVE